MSKEECINRLLEDLNNAKEHANKEGWISEEELEITLMRDKNSLYDYEG